MDSLDLAAAAQRLTRLLDRRARVLVGLAGPPGSGKTTAAQALSQAVEGVPGVVLGMDGFHLAHQLLVDAGAVERKGAIDTFDGRGYAALLARVVEPGAGPVWAPSFVGSSRTRSPMPCS